MNKASQAPHSGIWSMYIWQVSSSTIFILLRRNRDVLTVPKTVNSGQRRPLAQELDHEVRN
jgi:hypothetical protein